MRVPIVILILVTAVCVLCFALRTRRAASNASQTPTKAAIQSGVDRSNSQPRSSPTGAILADAREPEFVKRVLPVVRQFFATLDRAGVNPIKEELPYNSIQIHHAPSGMTCRFLLGDTWTATTYISSGYSGIIHFGQRGPDNPFRAISHSDTNALQRLSSTAISMPQAEAERIIKRISDALHGDRSGFEGPEIYREQMFDYELGMYSAQYRKKGSDPVNQLNYPISLSIKATSPTTAVLVSYLYDGRSGR